MIALVLASRIRPGEPLEIRSLQTIETAENIHIKVELAGLAARIFAFLVDAVLMGVLTAVVVGLFALWAFVGKSEEIAKTGMPIGTFVVFFGYHLFQEWLWNGRTVGKSLFHIRVVRNNGQAIGFWESLGRNLLRIVDVYASGVGLLCMMFNQGEKRFGDFVGGTMVINDAKILKPVYVASDESEQGTEFSGLRISAEEAELLKAYQSRRDKLLKEPRWQLAQSLCDYFSQKRNQSIHTDLDLDALLEAYYQGLRQA